jgi:hypothetical protein
VDVFRLLHRTHRLSQRAAYTVTMRIFRGGGLVKDAVYLRGLKRILTYAAGGGVLRDLFVGKIAAEHIAVVEELQHRGILKPTPLLPRFLELEDAERRLQTLGQGKSVLELVPEPEGRVR